MITNLVCGEITSLLYYAGTWLGGLFADQPVAMVSSQWQTNAQAPQSHFGKFHCAVKLKSTLSLLPFAPPMQVVVNGESPQVALAAATHPSHRPFVILITPAVAVSVNRALWLSPVVVDGEPRHCWISAWMPPHIESKATFQGYKYIHWLKWTDGQTSLHLYHDHQLLFLEQCTQCWLPR